MRVKELVAATAVAVVMAGGAAASTIKVDYQGNTAHGSYGKATVTLTAPGKLPVANPVSAGAFALNADSLGDFAAWCLDLATTMTPGKNYTVTDSPFSGNSLSEKVIGNIQKLFNTAYAALDLNENAESAGFQLALWELVYETGNKFDVSKGKFKASGDTAAVNFANGLLKGLDGDATQNYEMTFLQSKHSQNLVTANVAPIPLPAAGFLMLGALGGLGLAARKRRKTA